MTFSTFKYERKQTTSDFQSSKVNPRSTYAAKKMMTTGSFQSSSNNDGSSASNETTYHRFMSPTELNQFRTRLCPNISRYGKCPDGDACMDSHCKAFQRRDPSLVQYFVQLCPRISFVSTVDASGKKKMSLVNKCPYGKQCRFSHTQEERLYHPIAYKTQTCRGYPKCKPFCPFAHGKHELQKREITDRKIDDSDNVMVTSPPFDRVDNESKIEQEKSGKLPPISPPLSVTSTMAPSPLLLPDICQEIMEQINTRNTVPQNKVPDLIGCDKKDGHLPPGFALDDFSSSDEDDTIDGEDLLLFVLD